MKKADNFDASKWLVENKITFQSRLNENKTLGPYDFDTFKWKNQPSNPNAKLEDLENEDTVSKGDFWKSDIIGNDSSTPTYGSENNGVWTFTWESGEISGFIEGEDFTLNTLNENKIKGVDVDNDGEQITLSGDSGDYDGFIEDDGTVSFSVTNDEEDFNDQNWKSILGKNHVFVKVANAIDTKVEAMGDYVMITVKADDLTSMNESRLNENEDLAAKIAALPDFNSAMDREKSELIVGNYAVVRYDESDEGGENMYVVWDNTVNQDEIGSYDDVPEFESEDPAEVAAFLKKNESLNENEKISIENHKDEALETISDFIEEFEPQGLFEFIPSLDNYEIDSSTNSINIDELGSVYLIPNKGPIPSKVKELMMDSNNGEMNEDGATWKKYPKNGYYYIVVS